MSAADRRHGPWSARCDHARDELMALAAGLALEVGPHPTVVALLACAAHVARGTGVDADWFREVAGIAARAQFPDDEFPDDDPEKND